MKTKLYRTVSVNERLPNKSGFISVKAHEWVNSKEAFILSYYDGSCFFDQMDSGEEYNVNIEKYVTHWLEEVEIPREKEIEDFAKVDAYYPFYFVEGANFILDKLK